MNFTQNKDISLKPEKSNNTIERNTTYRILTHVDSDCIVVSMDEWNSLVKEIEDIDIGKPKTIDFTSLFSGVALTTFLTMSYNIFIDEFTSVKKDLTFIIISVILTILAIICSKYFSKGKSYDQNITSLEYIKEHLTRLENKCKPEKN